MTLKSLFEKHQNHSNTHKLTGYPKKLIPKPKSFTPTLDKEPKKLKFNRKARKTEVLRAILRLDTMLSYDNESIFRL